MQEKLRNDYDSLNNFISEITRDQSKVFNFQLHIMITANNPEELEMKKMQVRSYVDALGMKAIPLMFEQEKVLKSIRLLKLSVV